MGMAAVEYMRKKETVRFIPIGNICKLVPRWGTCINVLGVYVTK